jgi:hypothetical protein
VRWVRAAVVTVVLGCLGLATAAELPPRLISARTLFVVNDRVDAKVFNRIVSDLRKWRRFELVQSESDAHLIAVLSQQPSGIEIVPGEFGELEDKSNLYLVFKDGATRLLLWSEPAELPGNWESMVSRFRKRIERQESDR